MRGRLRFGGRTAGVGAAIAIALLALAGPTQAGPANVGTMTILPASAMAGSSGATLVLRYRAPSTIHIKGTLSIVVPTTGAPASGFSSPALAKLSVDSLTCKSATVSSKFPKSTFANHPGMVINVKINCPASKWVSLTIAGVTVPTVAAKYSFFTTVKGVALKSTPTETIEPAPTDHLVLTPALALVAPGAAQAYAVEGFDVYGNDVGDVTAATTFSIAPDGTCDNKAHECGSTVADSDGSHHTVTGTDGSASGTSKLTVESSWTTCGTGGPAVPGWDWDRHLTGPLSPPAQADALSQWLFVGDGPILHSLSTCTGATAGNFQLDGPIAGRPAVVQLQSGEFAAFVTTTAGSVFRVNVNPADGALSLGWMRDMRRGACPADRFDAGAVVQLRSDSSDAFQARFSDDVVYVATDDQCTDHTHNRVFALKAGDGVSLWTFNGAGVYAVDGIVDAPVVDPVTDRLYVGTQLFDGSPIRSTLFALAALTGHAAWTDTTGSVVVSPVISAGRIYVTNAVGNLTAYDATGTVIWHLALPSPISHDFVVEGGVIVAALESGVLARIVDSGSFPTMAPSTTLGVGVTATTGALWYGPGSGEIRLYMGGSDGSVWQVGITGFVEVHQAIGTGGTAACCEGALIVDPSTAGITSPAIVFGSASGELVKFDVPWTFVLP